MKLFVLLFIISFLFLSCSAGYIKSKSDLNGFWIMNEDHPDKRVIYMESKYSVFSFKNDSFFIEIGIISDDERPNYNPFRAKGIYIIMDDYLLFEGIAQKEFTKGYNMKYKKKFDYFYNDNILIINSLDKDTEEKYKLIRRPDLKLNEKNF